MDSKAYFEKVMQDFNQFRNGRSLRKYCTDEGIDYNEAFVFYSRDYRKVRILHYDVNGYVLYAKWFDDGKFLKPEFEESKRTHEISRDVLTLLLSTAVQTRILI